MYMYMHTHMLYMKLQVDRNTDITWDIPCCVIFVWVSHGISHVVYDTYGYKDITWDIPCCVTDIPCDIPCDILCCVSFVWVYGYHMGYPMLCKLRMGSHGISHVISYVV